MGKSQFNNVWEFIKNLPDIDTSLWMHDIFHEDFRPYDREEIEVIRECNRDKTLPENIGRVKRIEKKNRLGRKNRNHCLTGNSITPQ